jgi:ribonucleoside-diphosphate reductase alpha chain
MGQLTVDLSSRTQDLNEMKRSLTVSERSGINFPRHFTAKLESGRTPYDEIEWEVRTASIGNDKGNTIFEQRELEIPADWSQTATNIVASKYFHGKMGSPDRERSVAQLIHRVVDTIADWGAEGRYFRTAQDAENFRGELAYLMLTQRACFNSPVWFNVGVIGEARGYGWYYDEQREQVQIIKAAVLVKLLVLDAIIVEAYFFQHTPGTDVLRTARRKNPMELQFRKPVVQATVRGLSRIALSPVTRIKSVGQFALLKFVIPC